MKNEAGCLLVHHLLYVTSSGQQTSRDAALLLLCMSAITLRYDIFWQACKRKLRLAA